MRQLARGRDGLRAVSGVLVLDTGQTRRLPFPPVLEQGIAPRKNGGSPWRAWRLSKCLPPPRCRLGINPRGCSAWVIAVRGVSLRERRSRRISWKAKSSSTKLRATLKPHGRPASRPAALLEPWSTRECPARRQCNATPDAVTQHRHEAPRDHSVSKKLTETAKFTARMAVSRAYKYQSLRSVWYIELIQAALVPSTAMRCLHATQCTREQ